MRSRLGACSGIIVALAAAARADEPRHPETVSAVPGAHYEAGAVFRTLFGGRWRDDWTTSIRVPELDLSTYDGGLTPIRRGGRHGQQSLSLRLKGASGNTWAFRSVDKDPRKALAPEMRESLAADVLRDITTSSQHPAGAAVVAPLLEAVGVPHVNPELFVMPDDPRLGEFRDFAGKLGWIELRPGRGFAGSDKAVRTYELFDRLERRTDERLDARAYLRARLMDVFIGDWDRHANQWRWLRFDEGGERVWRPVPVDRDEAFSRFDGILPTIGEYYTKFLVSFHDEYPAIDKATFGGRYTDRRFLVGLEASDWRAVTSELVERLTDDTIASAVGRLPLEIYARDGAMLERALRARRDALPKASDAFYRLLAEEVDVYGTRGPDLASIRRSRDGTLELTVSARDEATGEAVGPPLFHRRFHAGETSEVRLYLLGGADRVVEEGDRDGAIRVRVVRGDPGADAERRAIVRAERERPAETGDGEDPLGDDERLTVRYERARDWGTDWLAYPQLSFDGTRGLVAGARLERTHFGFGREPFASQMNLAAAFSTGLSQPRVEYKLDLRTPSPLGATAYVAYSGMEYANYFGASNDSARDASLASRDFYKVDQHRFVARPLLTATLLPGVGARAGFAVERFSNTAHASTSPAAGAYGSGSMTLASAEAGLNVDTRVGLPTRRQGFEVDLSVRHYPAWLDNAAGFTKLRGEGTALLGSPLTSPVLFSLRVAGEKNWGRYPFFEAASIGGAALASPLDVASGSTGNPLRGYVLNRFSGDASVVANADLRIPLGRFNAIVPLRYGLLGVADVGRVFASNDPSSKWHPDAGGGAWIAMHAAGSGMEFATGLSFAAVHSDEGMTFYLSSSFGF